MGHRKPRFRASQPPNSGNKIVSHAGSDEGSTNHHHPIFNLEFLRGEY